MTLKNVNIKAAIVGNVGEAIEVTEGTVTFILEGENKLTAGYGAALYNAEGSTIILKGTGKLIAQGGNEGAGIGGSRNYRGWQVSVHAGVIKILDGTIEATGASGCPGIGAGCGTCEGVEILGGTVMADAGNGYACPAIGNSNVGGNGSIQCEYVTLKECVLTLYPSFSAAPIAATTTTPDLSKADEEPATVRKALDDANVQIYKDGTGDEHRWPATN